jgi:hypothetical protein
MPCRRSIVSFIEFLTIICSRRALARVRSRVACVSNAFINVAEIMAWRPLKLFFYILLDHMFA